MNARFVDIHQAADLLGPGAIELPQHTASIAEQARRRGIFGQRIRQVPATGHPSRYFIEGSREEHSVPLKAIAAEINYNLFEVDLELDKARRGQAAYLQGRDLQETVGGVFRAHDFALWNGRDTSLTEPTSREYCGAMTQIIAGGNLQNVGAGKLVSDGLQDGVDEIMRRNESDKSTLAIYANPVLLDLLERETRTFIGLSLQSKEITPGVTVKLLPTYAGDLPLIPDWTLPFTGTPGSGTAVLPAFIVTESLIEYHWLSDPNPRVFQLGTPGTPQERYAVIKFGGLVVKHPGTAHCQVLVER